MPTLAEVIAALDEWYPPATAESWDSVGLTCGDPNARVERVACAVDCVPATVEETVSGGAQLLLTHHPLLMSGVHSVATSDPKGSMIHRMITNGVAHFAAHTNADVARNGVNTALADLIGLLDVRPLDPRPVDPIDHLTVFVPRSGLETLIGALSAAGAGHVGNYSDCTFTVEGVGTYRPLEGADPAEGEIGVLSRVPEARLSMVFARSRRQAVIEAMRATHPYEEVAFELTEQPRLDAGTGSGRIGRLHRPTTLADFTALVAQRLPATTWGVRASGDPDRSVETVAVCGGSGGSYTDQARRAGADVFLTSDLKHHGVLEAVHERAGQNPMALIDAAHFATEAPWLDVVAQLLRARFGAALDVTVSAIVTDPWTVHEHRNN